MITVTCPHCCQRLQCLEQFAGVRITCPNCSGSIEVPRSLPTVTAQLVMDPQPPPLPARRPVNQLAVVILVSMLGGLVACGAFLTAITRPNTWRVNEGKPVKLRSPEEIAQEAAKRNVARAQRQTIVADLTGMGVLEVNWAGNTLQVWVTPKFMKTTFQQKVRACEILFAAAKRENNAASRINLLDYSTAKRLGRYTPQFGLEID